MLSSKIALSLTEQGLLPPSLSAAVARQNEMLLQGQVVSLGAPLPLQELLDIAVVTPADVARAGMDWRASAPVWAADLLDAK